MFQSTGSVAVAEVAVEPVPKRARVSDELAVADADEVAIEALFAGEVEEFKAKTGFEEFVFGSSSMSSPSACRSGRHSRKLLPPPWPS